MRKSRSAHSATLRSARGVGVRRRPAPWLPALCVLIALAVLVSMVLLGGSLGRFTVREAYTIPLTPQQEELSSSDAANSTSTSSAVANSGSADVTHFTAGSSATATSAESSPAASAGDSGAASTSANSETASAANSSNTTSTSEAGNKTSTTDPQGPATNEQDPAVGSAASSQGSQNAQVSEGGQSGQSGNLQVSDNAQVWNSETQVDLFQGSYDGTAVSADGDKLIAPGTTSSYDFMLRNNADVPMNYEVSLKVDMWSATNRPNAEDAADIPLEWRLLDADGASVSDWQSHDSSADVLASAKLDAGRQAGYAIEWRWAYEQDAEGAAGTSGSSASSDASSGDAADTAHGNHAVSEDFGAKATIIVRAEQIIDPEKPDDPTKPEDPTNPDDPTKPEDPSNPEDPATGDNPSNPPDPSNPKDPADVPSADDAQEPKTPQEFIASLLPKTGDEALAMLVAGVAVVALLVLVIAARRKRREDANDVWK